jgi:hypothetical protein
MAGEPMGVAGVDDVVIRPRGDEFLEGAEPNGPELADAATLRQRIRFRFGSTHKCSCTLNSANFR